jgi:anaerobic selenocysteine-containing dehydrogenase
VNTRIFPEPAKFREALQKLDFIFATDLFWTDMCSYADIVLPVCSSLERSEVKCYPGGNYYYTSPAIEPLYESRDDVAVMTELAKRLCSEDQVLCAGYHESIKYMFREIADEVEEAKASGRPVHSRAFRPYIPGTYLKNGPETATGKLELYSELIARIDPSYRLDPLPVYYDSNHGVDPEKYPFVLMTGARLPHTIHSRAHKVPWLRSLRPDPSVDINPADAERLGICQGDPVRLYTETGEIHVRANVTEVANQGELHMIHGYEEANASDLISWEYLDPYSGFPSYKQLRCAIGKEEPHEL